MNTDGLELTCDDDIKEQGGQRQQHQQQQRNNAIYAETSKNSDRGGDGGGVPAAATATSLRGEQDVAMEMPTNFPDWSSSGGGVGLGGTMRRRVSFPNDKNLVTGYMEPANPWANVKSTYSGNELLDLYRESCRKHHVSPLDRVVDQLDGLQVPVERSSRLPQLHLNDQVLTIAQCESLEEILKRVRYKSIDVSSCSLDDTTATALFDMVEYYEAANELDISNNPRIEQRGLQACANMIKRCCSLLALYAHHIAVSEQSAKVLGNAMMSSAIHTLKLEYCKLSGRPIATLCSGLAKNTALKELWLASNELSDYDAFSIARLLKSNYYLQYLDISNNKIQDNGVSHIVLALIEQSQYFKSHGASLLPVNGGGCGGSAAASAAAKDSQVVVSSSVVAVASAAIPTTALSSGEYVKKPPRSPVVEEDMAKDVNDNIREGKQHANDQWDFLGDSNNNSSDQNDNETEQRSVEATNTGQKIGFIIDGAKAAAAEEDLLIEKVVMGETGVDVDQRMEVENVLPSSAIDINCNNVCSVTEYRAASDGDSEPITPSSPSSVSSKDLIDFDSPQHHSSGVKDDDELLGQSGDQVGMFKLDEEEAEQRNSNSHSSCKSSPSLLSSSSISILQMPDSPASVASMQSTDADSGCEASSYTNHDGSFSTPPPSSLPKRFKMSLSDDGQVEAEGAHRDDGNASTTTTTQLKSERSLSSESLNSEASMESNDSKSSLRLSSTRFSKNGTLERQTSNSQNVVPEKPQLLVAPTGLQVLVLWNNLLTKKCGQAISDMIKGTSTLEVLNVGKNVLGNEFVSAIKASLCANESIAKLGLQSVHLTCSGAKTVAEVIEAKCGSALTRVDLRDNNIQVTGLTALSEAVKCNRSVTQIDLNASPHGGGSGDGASPEMETVVDPPSPDAEERLKLVRSIRDQCLANETPPEVPTASTTHTVHSGGKHKTRSRYSGPGAKCSRKISLTCQSVKPEFLIPAVPTVSVKGAAGGGSTLLDPARKSSGRLKSPLPSPIPSPSPSPIPSPSRSRFQVSRVQESVTASSLSPLTPPSSTSSSPTNSMSRFRVTAVQEAKPKTTVVARSQAMSIPSGSSGSGGHGGGGIGSGSSSAGNVVGKEQKASQQENNNIFFGSTLPLEVLRGGEVKPVKGASSNKRLQSVSLDTISSSLDSPDLEVKRIMMLDDSSSIGSLDSYTAQFVPAASLSSTESLDVREERTPELHLRLGCKMSIDSSVESISEKCNNLVLQEPPLRRLSAEVLPPQLEERLSVPATAAAATTTTTRTRKTSWIPANQATIDKLMSIFQNPFSRQASPNDHHVHEEKPSQQVSPQVTVVAVNEPAAARKDNSLGNLLNWAASGMRDKSSTEKLAEDVAAAATARQTVLIPNTRSESNNNAMGSSKEAVGGAAALQLDSELISDSLMNEIKENISPEHTITASAVQQQQQQGRSPLTQGGGDLVRVKFKLGSTEDFDELLMAEDEELLMESPQRPYSASGSTGGGGMTSDDSCLSLDVEGGIGQIARDSMVMFNSSASGGGGGSGGGASVKASSPLTSKGE